jgi:adenylate kinase
MRPNLHIFGIQGSGKDTQAARIAKHFGLCHISSGAILRARMQMSDTVGQFLAKEMHSGRLVPDEFLLQLVETSLMVLPKEQGIICAGVIRTAKQDTDYAEVWQKLGFDAPFAVILDVSEDVAMARAIARNRSDDTKEALTQRFKDYREQTQPLIARFEESGQVIHVNGELSQDEVCVALITALVDKIPTLHGIN